jgi:hypothetical protein
MEVQVCEFGVDSYFEFVHFGVFLQQFLEPQPFDHLPLYHDAQLGGMALAKSPVCLCWHTAKIFKPSILSTKLLDLSCCDSGDDDHLGDDDDEDDDDDDDGSEVGGKKAKRDKTRRYQNNVRER